MTGPDELPAAVRADALGGPLLPRPRTPLDGYAVVLVEVAALRRLDELATDALYGTDPRATRAVVEAIPGILGPLLHQLPPEA